jgi:hypothetical protein
MMEYVPSSAPTPRGKPMHKTALVDAEHAGDIVTRCKGTGVPIYLNKSHILWYSTNQNIVDTSIFGSLFIALKTGIDYFKGLRYKLRKMRSCSVCYKEYLSPSFLAQEKKFIRYCESFGKRSNGIKHCQDSV